MFTCLGHAPRRGALRQPFTKTTFATQPPLDPPHQAVVSLVVVADEMQEAVEGENPKLSEIRVTGRARLPPRDAASDDDVSEEGVRG